MLKSDIEREVEVALREIAPTEAFTFKDFDDEHDEHLGPILKPINPKCIITPKQAEERGIPMGAPGYVWVDANAEVAIIGKPYHVIGDHQNGMNTSEPDGKIASIDHLEGTSVQAVFDEAYESVRQKRAKANNGLPSGIIPCDPNEETITSEDAIARQLERLEKGRKQLADISEFELGRGAYVDPPMISANDEVSNGIVLLSEKTDPSCDFLVARQASAGEKVDEYRNVIVTAKIEVQADNQKELLRKLYYAIAEREIDPDECHGAFGWPSNSESFWFMGINWQYDNTLSPCMAVIWHRNAVVTPCTVLQPDGIIYGTCANA